MRARYYNQDIKRFINRDVLSGDITNSQSMNRYCYVQGNPVSLTDPFGLCPTAEEIRKIELRGALHKTLDVIGIFFDGADVLNAIIYALEGDNVHAELCLVFFIPGVGSAVGLTVKYVFKIGGNAGEALAKFAKKYAPELAESGGKFVKNVGGKLDDVGRWIQRKADDAWKWIQKKLGKVGNDDIILPKPGAPDFIGPLTEIDAARNANWVKPDGTTWWPPNNGAVPGTEQTVILKRGTIFGRIGGKSGIYVAPPNTLPEMLALKPGTDTSVYTEYRVIRDIPKVQQAEVLAWFDMPGGGIQYKLPDTIQKLLDEGYIEPIK